MVLLIYRAGRSELRDNLAPQHLYMHVCIYTCIQCACVFIDDGQPVAIQTVIDYYIHLIL